MLTRDVTGDWRNACQLFKFHLPIDGHVIVDLKGHGLDTEILLHRADHEFERRGLLRSNNDSLESNTLNSRLGMGLDRGNYVVEARLVNPQAVDATTRLTLEMVRQELVPHGGLHQRDHAVFFYFEPLPDEEPEDSFADDMSLQDVYPMLRAAAYTWHRALSGSWPDIVFCEIPSNRPECRGRNRDEANVQVRTAPTTSCPPFAVACVYNTRPLTNPLTDHISASSLTIVTPVVAMDYYLGLPVRGLWTLDEDRHLEEVDHNPWKKYLWFYRTALHEWGHTLMLDDLYAFPSLKYHYLMGYRKPLPNGGIPATDIEYAHQVYRQHGGRPH